MTRNDPRSRREPWRLVLGYGSERRWRRTALQMAVIFFFIAPVSCYVAERRKAERTFDTIQTRLAALTRAGVKRPPEAAFAYVEAPAYRLQGISGNASLLRGLDLAEDQPTIRVAERARTRGQPAITPHAVGNAFLVFTPRPPGWNMAAFRIEDLLRAAEPHPNIRFDVFEAGSRARLDNTARAEPAGLLFSFAHAVPVYDQHWLIYQHRYRLIGDALLAPGCSVWLFGSLACCLVWFIGGRRHRSFELGTTVLDTMVDVVLVIDPQFRIVYASPSVGGALGYDPDSLPGRPFADLFHPDDAAAAIGALRRGRETDEAVPIERLRMRAKDESWHNVSGTSRRLLEGKTLIDYLVTLHDVTNLLGLERQLEAAERVESLGRVAANVAHEFRNLLMALDVNLDLLRQSVTGEKPATLIDTLRRYVRRGSGIADEILRVAAPTELHLSTIDAGRWLVQLERDLRPLVAPKAELSTRVEEPFVFQGDEDRLSQVLTNLVLNSRDAIRERGHVRCVAARSRGGNFTFGIVPTGDFVHVAVQDDGEGMTHDTARRIFEPLFTTKRNGTGLGLAISKQIVAAHQGLLFAESDQGKGTTMHIFLPLESGTETAN